MLVLSRKLQEKVFIGGDICITVVDIDRGKIRLGIEAPHDIPVMREELMSFKDWLEQRAKGRTSLNRTC